MLPVERIMTPCGRCGMLVAETAAHRRRGRGQFCSRSCAIAAARDARRAKERAEFERYFWSWVDQSAGADACWPWLGKSNTRGYGRYKLYGRSHFAHRYALTASKGAPADERATFALHSCDNPTCCNPTHLRWGTAQDNADDRTARSRAGCEKRRLIDRTALATLRAEGWSYSKLARHFGVNQASIGKALRALIALPTSSGEAE